MLVWLLMWEAGHSFDLFCVFAITLQFIGCSPSVSVQNNSSVQEITIGRPQNLAEVSQTPLYTFPQAYFTN